MIGGRARGERNQTAALHRRLAPVDDQGGLARVGIIKKRSLSTAAVCKDRLAPGRRLVIEQDQAGKPGREKILRDTGIVRNPVAENIQSVDLARTNEEGIATGARVKDKAASGRVSRERDLCYARSAKRRDVGGIIWYDCGRPIGCRVPVATGRICPPSGAPSQGVRAQGQRKKCGEKEESFDGNIETNSSAGVKSYPACCPPLSSVTNFVQTGFLPGFDKRD